MFDIPQSRPTHPLFGFVLVLLSIGYLPTVSADHDHEYASENYRNEPIQPIPKEHNVDPLKAALGRRLFHEPRLSSDNTISCASCHPLERGGVDGLARSIGINGAISDINTPTVFNSSFNFVQFWDGRANNLEEQAEGPIHNPKEMGSSWSEVIAKLSNDTEYQQEFAEIYQEAISAETIQDAIANFERTLINPNARFDRFLRGDEEAISAEEKQGYLLFKSYGCASCHQGVGVGGNLYQKMGVMRDYFKERGKVSSADYGRYNVTGIEAHRFQFKVPSLRNVALTAPYFHDASAPTLKIAVAIMARHQLGRPISAKDKYLIIAFLKTLTGARWEKES